MHKHKVGLCPDYAPEHNNNPEDRKKIKLQDGDAWDALNVLRSLKEKLETKSLVDTEVFSFAKNYIKKRLQILPVKEKNWL